MGACHRTSDEQDHKLAEVEGGMILHTYIHTTVINSLKKATTGLCEGYHSGFFGVLHHTMNLLRIPISLTSETQ